MTKAEKDETTIAKPVIKAKTTTAAKSTKSKKLAEPTTPIPLTFASNTHHRGSVRRVTRNAGVSILGGEERGSSFLDSPAPIFFLAKKTTFRRRPFFATAHHTHAPLRCSGGPCLT